MATTNLEKLAEYPGTGPVTTGALFHARRVSDSQDFRVPAERVPGGNTPANLRPGGPFEVVWRGTATPGYVAPANRTPAGAVPGYSTLADIAESLICFGCTATTAFSEDGPGSVYVPVYDAVGFTMHVNKDGYFGPDNNIPARWALKDSVAAARANLRTWSNTIADWTLNETLLYVLNGIEGFYQTQVAGGPFPAPTGPNDTYYRQVAPPLPADVLTPNNRPDFRKVVAYESTATPGYAAGRSTVADILATSALHTEVVVEFSQYGYGKTLEFVYDGAARTGADYPGLQLPREFGGGLVPVKLVLPDSAAAALANIRPITASQPTPPFVLDDVGTYTLAGTEGFYRYLAPAGGTYAVPTAPDDANWHQVAPPVAGTARFQALSVKDARLLAAAGDTIQPIDYVILRAAGNVTLRGIVSDTTTVRPGRFSETGFWQDPAANATAPAALVSYDLAANTTGPVIARLSNLEAVLHIATATNPNQRSISVGGNGNAIGGLESAAVGGGRITITGNDSGAVGGSLVTISGTNSGSVGGTQSSISGQASGQVGGYSNSNAAETAAIIGGRSVRLPVGADRSVILGGLSFTAPAQTDTAFLPQAYLFTPGGGISLLSPDGLTRRILSIDNAGNLLISAPASAAPTISNASFTAA